MRISHTSSTKLPKIIWMSFCETSGRQPIMAAISAKDITRNMVRVKSSNIWSYTINGRNGQDSKLGDVYVQFKGKHGGPGDVYVYYDVPVKIYKQMLSAPSKGHSFWQNLRGKYSYAKLTGDKRTKRRGGVNSPNETRI